MPIQYLYAKDADGISLKCEILKRGENNRNDFSDYLKTEKPIFIEPHIEQGLELKNNNQALGLVKKISGQTLCTITFTGRTAHAVEKWSRRSSLTTACELVSQSQSLALLDECLHITFGSIENHPNLTNVVSSRTVIKVDIRHIVDDMRAEALKRLVKNAKGLAALHNVELDIDVQEKKTSHLNDDILRIMENVCNEHGIGCRTMFSYAGHDASVLNEHIPSGLLFLRDQKGISHHPEEAIQAGDIATALAFFSKWANGKNMSKFRI